MAENSAKMKRVCPSCESDELSYATSDPFSDAQMSCTKCGFEGLADEFTYIEVQD